MYSWFKKADSPYYKSKIRSSPKEDIGRDMIRLWNYIKRNKNMTATFYHGTSSVFLAESMKSGYLSAPSVRKAQDRENRKSGLDEVFVTTSFSYALFYASRSYEQIERAESGREDNEPVILELEIPIYMIKEFSDIILKTEKNIYNEYDIPRKIFQIIAEGIMNKYPIEIQAENLLNFIIKSYNQTDNEFTIKYVLPTRFIKSNTLKDRDFLMRIVNEYTKHWSEEDKEKSPLYSKDTTKAINLIPKSRKNEPWAIEIQEKLYLSKIFDSIENYNSIDVESYDAIKKLPNYKNNEIKIKDFIIRLIKSNVKSPSMLIEGNFLDIFSRYKEIYEIYRSYMEGLSVNNLIHHSSAIFNNYTVVSDPKNRDTIVNISRKFYLNEIENEGASAVLKAYDAIYEYQQMKSNIERLKKEPNAKETVLPIYLNIYNRTGVYPAYIESVIPPFESDKEAMNALYSYMSKNILKRTRSAMSENASDGIKNATKNMYDIVNQHVEEYASEEEKFFAKYSKKTNPINIKIDRNYLSKLTLSQIRANETRGQISGLHEDIYSSHEYKKSLLEYWRDIVQYNLRPMWSFPEELSKDIDFMKKFYKYLIQGIEDNIQDISYIPKFLLSENIKEIACNSFINIIQKTSLRYLGDIIQSMPPFIIENSKVRNFCINYISSAFNYELRSLYPNDLYDIISSNNIHHFMDDQRIQNSFLNSVIGLSKNLNPYSVKQLHSFYILDKQNGFKFLNNKKILSVVENAIKEAYLKFALYEYGGNPFEPTGDTGRNIMHEDFVLQKLSEDTEFRKNFISNLFSVNGRKTIQYNFLISIPELIVNDPLFIEYALNSIKTQSEASNATYDIRSVMNSDVNSNKYKKLLDSILSSISNGSYKTNQDTNNSNQKVEEKTRRTPFTYPPGHTPEWKTIPKNNVQSCSDNWYILYKESQFSINDENIDKEKIYNTFKDTYEKSTGKSWSKEKFFNRSGEWRFYGDQNGYVTVREQKSGMLKLTGMAGSLKSILKGLEQLKQENAPIWGMVSKDISSMANRVGFQSVDASFVKNNIQKIPSYVFGGAKILSIQDDGGIVFEYSDVGEAVKYLVGNDKYVSMIQSFSLFASS